LGTFGKGWLRVIRNFGVWNLGFGQPGVWGFNLGKTDLITWGYWAKLFLYFKIGWGFGGLNHLTPWWALLGPSSRALEPSKACVP